MYIYIYTPQSPVQPHHMVKVVKRSSGPYSMIKIQIVGPTDFPESCLARPTDPAAEYVPSCGPYGQFSTVRYDHFASQMFHRLKTPY